MSEPISKQLRRWRGGLYQKQAAEKLGVSIWTYKSWETNRRIPWSMARRIILKMIAEESTPKKKLEKNTTTPTEKKSESSKDF